MASLHLALNNGFWTAQEKLNLCVGGSKSYRGQRTRSWPISKNNFGPATSPHFLVSKYCRNRCHRLSWSNKIRVSGNEMTDSDNQLVREGRNRRKKRRFSLRLRPRLRSLSRRLNRTSIRAMLDSLGTFLRKNVQRIMFSAALGLCFLFLKTAAKPTPKVVPYSDLIMSLKNGNVTMVLFEEGTRRVFYNTKMWKAKDTKAVTDTSSCSNENVLDNGSGKDVSLDNVDGKELTKPNIASVAWEFCTRKIDHDEGYLLFLMRATGVLYGSAPRPVLESMKSMLSRVFILGIAPTLSMWLLFSLISDANSPAKKRIPSNQLVRFQDVEGVDAAKVELKEIVSCLQGATNYAKLGAKLPRGVLLVGPPGTGKTLLGRAVAGEAGVPFFYVCASEFVELFVGRGAARVRELFSAAKKSAPSIIFIDELDAVGGKRGRSFNDERDQTLNQLLTEMDGFESNVNVVVIGATNRAEALDPALCRPGRFSRKVYVGEPNEEGRKKILEIHLRGVPLEEDLGLICHHFASLTRGFVGADLANIVNKAVLLAARRGAESVSREDIMEAIRRGK